MRSRGGQRGRARGRLLDGGRLPCWRSRRAGEAVQTRPPLGGIAQRVYLAGVLSNTPEHLMRWIQDPGAVDSLTAMPDVGVTPADARDIAAYLYTLR